MPFLLRTFRINYTISPETAKRNLASVLKFHQFEKNPSLIDKTTSELYIILHEAEH